MIFVLSGGDLGGQEVDFPTGALGESVDVIVAGPSGNRLAHYVVQEYDFGQGPVKLAVFSGYQAVQIDPNASASGPTFGP